MCMDVFTFKEKFVLEWSLEYLRKKNNVHSIPWKGRLKNIVCLEPHNRQ